MSFSSHEIDQVKKKIKNKSSVVGGCRIMSGYKQEGYSKIYFKGKTYRTHRLVYEIYNGKIPEGMVIRHLCHKRACCEISHLKLGTHKDNSNDKIKAGRANPPRGENCNFAKLTASDVRSIKILFEIEKWGSKKEMYEDIAKRFNVSTTCIKFIFLRKTWRHIP